MATVKQSGNDSVLMTRPVGGAEADWKMLSCQTSYSLTSSNNPTEVVSKCGTDYIPGNDVDEARLDGFIIKKSTDAKILDTVAIRALYDSKEEQEFALLPKVASAASDDLEVHNFTGVISSFDETFPVDSATFSMSIRIIGGVTSDHYTYVAP